MDTKYVGVDTKYEGVDTKYVGVDTKTRKMLPWEESWQTEENERDDNIEQIKYSQG